jgi:hypothetical protein
MLFSENQCAVSVHNAFTIPPAWLCCKYHDFLVIILLAEMPIPQLPRNACRCIVIPTRDCIGRLIYKIYKLPHLHSTNLSLLLILSGLFLPDQPPEQKHRATLYDALMTVKARTC